MDKNLIQKYNIPGPRYTSYPTVPYWDNSLKIDDWKSHVKNTFHNSNQGGISIYIHLPFCEKLCTYCGCHTRITKNHKVEEPYIQNLIKEWNIYRELFDNIPRINQIHLGGGTPTFFSPDNLKLLIDGLANNSIIENNAELSFEGHPNNTTYDHLKTLYDLGFKRVSFGIQDFDPTVQEIVNRIQPFEKVQEVNNYAREIGYTSINFDLIYGLPLQNLNSVEDTIQKVNILKPDRIAFYSYAHVPWIKSRQRKFTEADLPADGVKRELYEVGKRLFEESGYVEIGMDHFALKNDSLYKAMEDKKLHRNFMGYSDSHNELMIGLGVSSISDTWTAFGQNLKDFKAYNECISNNELPIFKGHILNDEDLVIRKTILNIMCNFESKIDHIDGYKDIIIELSEMIDDGLVEIENGTIKVPQKGIPFVRNICMAFDLRLKRKKPETALFSKTV